MLVTFKNKTITKIILEEPFSTPQHVLLTIVSLNLKKNLITFVLFN